jgi:hypothetical protein
MSGPHLGPTRIFGHVFSAPGWYRGGISRAERGDVHDPSSLREALTRCDSAYYLVHSLEETDFARRDAVAARNFADAATDVGLRRIVPLGGLGDDGDELSPHLRSRREVEGLLGSAGVPVTTLRAGIIVGHGGISWEMTRQLVEHLPAMITPRWVRTRTQPIAVHDVIRYLVGVRPPRSRGRHPRHRRTGRAREVIAHDDSIRDLVPFEPMGYDDAVLRAGRTRENPSMTIEWRRRVVAVAALSGAGLLGTSLSLPPDSAKFYGTATTWTVGGLASGPLHLGRARSHGRTPYRPILAPISSGVVAFGVFYGCALVARAFRS